VLLAFVVLASDPAVVRMLIDGGISVGGALRLLPPPLVLEVLALATTVAVPVSSVTQGVRRDLRSNRSRQHRLENP